MEELEKYLKHLNRPAEVALATVEGDKPAIRVFQVMRREGTTLYFATGKQKRVYQQLLSNPNVEIMAMRGNVFVKAMGRADFAVDDATCQAIYAENPVLPRLYADYKLLAYFKMDIEGLEYYDLRPTPPVCEFYDLREQK